MSGCSNVISVRVATVGLANKTIVHPREVFIHAIKDNASSIIIAQNHPSDNASPSDEDREVTRMLQNAGGILGIKVLDHAIVVKSGYYSLKQNNEM
jgi:DNA repair protein RadC